MEGIIQGVLHLGLQHFTGQFIGNGNQKRGTDQSLCLGKDDKATLPGGNPVVLFEEADNPAPGTSDSIGVVCFVYCHQPVPSKLALPALPAATSPDPGCWSSFIHRVMHSPWIIGY